MIQVSPPGVHQVLEEVRSLKGVAEAHESTGPFDIVALIDTNGVSDLPSLLYRTTFTMPGVCAAAVVTAEEALGQREDSRASG